MLVPAHLLSLGALIDIGLHSRVDSNLSILFSGGGSVFAEEYLSPSICRVLQRQLISACLCGSLTTQQFLCRGEATRWGARRSSAKWRVGSQPSAGFFSIQKVTESVFACSFSSSCNLPKERPFRFCGCTNLAVPNGCDSAHEELPFPEVLTRPMCF